MLGIAGHVVPRGPAEGAVSESVAGLVVAVVVAIVEVMLVVWLRLRLFYAFCIHFRSGQNVCARYTIALLRVVHASHAWL